MSNRGKARIDAVVRKVSAAKKPKEKTTIKRQKEPEPKLGSVNLDGKEIERDKRLIMWSGVAFFMVLILTFWVFNLKNVFKKTVPDKNESAQIDWKNISSELGEVFGEIKKGVEEIKEIQTKEANQEAIATSSPENNLPDNNSENIQELKLRLEKLEEQMDN